MCLANKLFWSPNYFLNYKKTHTFSNIFGEEINIYLLNINNYQVSKPQLVIFQVFHDTLIFHLTLYKENVYLFVLIVVTIIGII